MGSVTYDVTYSAEVEKVGVADQIEIFTIRKLLGDYNQVKYWN
jgi:hypothetical protein